MGDVLLIMKKNLVWPLLDHPNSQHPLINFTAQVDNNGKLPYLDVTSHWEDNTLKLEIDVCCKLTNTGRYFHYKSNHTNSGK